MRIAYLTQFYPPAMNGVAVVARRLAEGLASLGHTVLVIAPSDQPYPYQTCDGNLTVLRLRSARNKIKGQNVLIFPRSEIQEALKRFNPDLIHTHENMAIGWLAVEYGHRTNIPVVATLHQLPWMAKSYFSMFPRLATGMESAIWELARWFLPQYAAVIAPSRTASEMVAARARVFPHSISNGVDLGCFNASLLSGWQDQALRSRLALPMGVPIILHVGRLDPEKNVSRVILAAERAMHVSTAHLLVVGDGPERSALIELCNSLGIASCCHFTGFICVQDGLPEIYRLATLFTTASEIETQGLVLLEAAASGLPIAAARATCVPEIVEDGVNGFLAEPGDTEGLGRAMLRLLAEPSLAHAMGKHSALLARQHDVRNTLEAHERLYLAVQREALVSHSAVEPARALARYLPLIRNTARR